MKNRLKLNSAVIVAPSTAEYEWAISILHKSAWPGRHVGTDIQAILSAKPFPWYGTLFSEEGLLFTYM